MEFANTPSRSFIVRPSDEYICQVSYILGKYSSTKNGNEILANAFMNTRDIYLYFSPLWSGQFVGLAKMTSLPVELKGGWKQFGVEWLIVKDIPNHLLDHIKFIKEENWGAKPTEMSITNSGDVQEIPEVSWSEERKSFHRPADEMLRIFKEFKEYSSFLDDMDLLNNIHTKDNRILLTG